MPRPYWLCFARWLKVFDAMPTYTFRCPHPGHPERRITRGMREPVPAPPVCEVCGAGMERRYEPPLAVGRDPWEVLSEKMDRNYRRWRARRETTSKRRSRDGRTRHQS